MSKQQNIATFHRIANELWSNFNRSLLEEFYHEDVVAYMGDQIAHYKDIVHRFNYCKEHYAGITWDIHSVVADDNRVAAHVTQTLLSKDSESDQSFNIIFIYTFKQGKVIRLDAVFDPGFNYFE